MDICAKILKANCLHNGCFQKYRGVDWRADQGFGGAPLQPSQLFSLLLPFTGPVMLGEVWWEQSDSFYSATWSSPLHLSDYTAYWAAQQLPDAHRSPRLSSPLNQPSSSSVLSLSGLWEYVWWYVSEWAYGKAERVRKTLPMPVIDLYITKGATVDESGFVSLLLPFSWLLHCFAYLESFVWYLTQMLNSCTVKLAYLGCSGLFLPFLSALSCYRTYWIAQKKETLEACSL